MASGSNNLTSYKAKQIIGSSVAASPAGALLFTGENYSGNTWIYHYGYGGTTNPWGIRHDTTAQEIIIKGNGTDSFWIKMNTGDTYIYGKVGIGYDPNTSGNSYKLYVDGDVYFDDTTYLNDNVGIGYNPATTGNTYKLYVNGSTNITGTTTLGDYLYRAYTASSQTPMIWMNGSDYDNYLWQIGSGTANGEQYYGYGLKYTGTGSDVAKYLQLIADNQNGTDVIAIGVNQSGQIGLGTNANTSYRLYVSGTTWLNDHLYLAAAKKIHMQYTPSGESATNFIILENHNNGNVSLSAAGGGLYIGYYWTKEMHFYYSTSASSRTEFFQINSNGSYALTRFGVNGQNTSYTLYVNGTITATNTIYSNGGYLQSTANGNTVTIGSQNTGWCHFNNSADISFYFNKAVHAVGGFTVYNTNSYLRGTDFRVAGTGRFDGMLIINSLSNSTQNYTTAAMQVREYNYGGTQSDNWSTAPRLGFHWSGRNAAQIGLASNGYLYECPGTGTTFYKLVYESGSWGINITGSAGSATYASSYLANRGSVSGSTHAEALKAYFNSNKASEPRNVLVAHYSSAHGNGSLCMGYFLSGYDSSPYGGFFICHYNNPRYVGISNGTYTQHDIMTNQNYTSWTVTKTGSGASGTWGISISGNAATATTSSKITIAGGTGATKYNVIGVPSYASGAQAVYVSSPVTVNNVGVFNAVWNDYAEYRSSSVNEPGYAINPYGNKTTHRLESGVRIISDTYGFSVGGDEDSVGMAPIGLAGRVLAYPYRDKSEYKIGDAVCSAPGGTIDIMTREEIKEYPERIIGIINEIPDYEIWEPSRDDNGRGVIYTKGRIWIDIK